MIRLISFFCALTFALPAFAGTAEVKELARTYNCQVTEIKPVSLETGMEDSATYKVGCAMPEGVSEQEKKANGTLLIRCTGALCALIKKGEEAPAF